MEPRWSQDGNKIGPKSLKRNSGIAYFPGLPKIVKIGVSCKRGAISGMAMVQNCCTAAAPKLSPPSNPPTLRDRVGTTKHVTSYTLFQYISISIGYISTTSDYRYGYTHSHRWLCIYIYIWLYMGTPTHAPQDPQAYSQDN